MILAIPTSSSVRPECQLYRVNCRVRCNELLAGASLGWLRSPDAAKEALDAKIFVDFGPMDAFAVTEKLPVSALLRRSR
jgi:hypothetical protein